MLLDGDGFMNTELLAEVRVHWMIRINELLQFLEAELLRLRLLLPHLKAQTKYRLNDWRTVYRFHRLTNKAFFRLVGCLQLREHLLLLHPCLGPWTHLLGLDASA